MMNIIKQWLYRRRRAAQNKICRRDGHWLTKNGFAQEGKVVVGVPVGGGPETAWIMICCCGYGEICDVNTAPYRRSYSDGEKMKQEQGEIRG